MIYIPPMGGSNMPARVIRDGFSLAMGVLTGTVLGAGVSIGPTVVQHIFIWIYRSIQCSIYVCGVHHMSDALTQIAVIVSFCCSLFIAILALPIWLVGKRFDRGTIVDAAALGGLLGASVGLYMVHSDASGLIGICILTLLFGVVGIFCGIVTWCTSRHGFWSANRLGAV
jgi:hypothetical protein